MITRIPAYLYRGGTSKGPLILAHDLPADRRTRDAALLAAMGSPHKRQIDGIGGAETLTSKIAVVSESSRPGIDVDYLFIQVNPESDIVDYSSNCGNMLSAVGPFAIEMGLVKAKDPETKVSIFNINTNSKIEVILQTPGGAVTYEGNAAIDGVPGTAAPVKQNFAATVGSKTGKLLPTGSAWEIIDGIDDENIQSSAYYLLARNVNVPLKDALQVASRIRQNNFKNILLQTLALRENLRPEEAVSIAGSIPDEYFKRSTFRALADKMNLPLEEVLKIAHSTKTKKKS